MQTCGLPGLEKGEAAGGLRMQGAHGGQAGLETGKLLRWPEGAG